MSPDSISPERAEELKNIMEELESMNHEAMANNLWIRTKWNSANQKPWHTYDAEPPAIPEHGLPLENAVAFVGYVVDGLFVLEELPK